MAKVFINDATLKAIGNAIRGKTGRTDLMVPSAMSMAIENISAGSSVTIDGEAVEEELALVSELGFITSVPLPSSSYNGCAVVHEGAIHVLGGGASSANQKTHHKFDGVSWTEVSTLPYAFTAGCAVVYDGYIHILGASNDSYDQYFYKWDGTAWTKLTNLPVDHYYGCCVVYNDEIHIIGGSGTQTKHYKWDKDTDTWTSVSTIPCNIYYACAVVHDDAIYVYGGTLPLSDAVYADGRQHCKWDGVSWTELPLLPMQVSRGMAVSYEGNIHLMASAAEESGELHVLADVLIYRKAV